MKKKNPPEWLRWGYLAVAAAWPVSIRMDYREYSRYSGLGIFSPEELTEIMAGMYYSWAYYILMFVFFLFQFITFHWEKSDSKYLLCERVLFIITFALWVCLPFIVPLPKKNGLWVLVLVILGAAVIYVLYKIFENRHQEEEYYE